MEREIINNLCHAFPFHPEPLNIKITSGESRFQTKSDFLSSKNL